MKYRNSITRRAGRWAAIGCVLAGAVLFSGSQTWAQAPDDKPNVVLIFMDNYGWGEPGCYGGGVLRGAPTPRIDKLAE
jgi:arylsulfatase